MASAAHAHDVHARTQSKAITLHAVGVSKQKLSISKKHGFSFPVALSQVRDRVYSRAQTIAPTHISAKKKQKRVLPPVKHSPYILDLKHRRTVVHSFSKPKPAAFRATTQKATDRVVEQGVLSLFDDHGSERLPLASKLVGLLSSFRPAKHINLVPRQNVTISRRVRRQWYAMKWQMQSTGRMLLSPVQHWRERRLQRTFALPVDFAALKAPAVAQITRTGRPISVSRVAHLLQRRSQAEEKNTDLSLSRLNDHGQSRGWTLSWRPSVAWARASLSFAVISLLFVGSVGVLSAYRDVRQYQNEVFGATNLAISELRQAQSTAGELAFLPAAEQFERAGQGFQAASAVMRNQAPAVAKIAAVIPGANSKLQAAAVMLNLGHDLAQAATSVSQGVSVFSDPQHFLHEQPLSYKLEYFFVRLQEAQPLVSASANAIKSLDIESLPAEAVDQVRVFQQSMPALASELERLDRVRDPLLTFLGHQSTQRYLIMFQNNTELRATGGFMGSFALVDMDRGEIKRIEIPGGGPYDMQGGLLDYYQAPRALQLVNPRWEFQDTNWFLDWPTSAAAIAKFYERAGGPSVDGVIAVDTHVMEEILRLVGPVELPQYGAEITADNFRDILQQQVEVDYDRTENKPKKIIGDLAPELLKRVKELPVERSLELAAVLGGLLDQRSIQIFHHDEDVSQVFASMGWDGRVADAAGDYVSVVHTNIAGGKTDGVIRDDYDLRVHIAENGEVTNTLTVRREHTGKKGATFSGVRNVDYLRVYVPKGSVLVSASGFERPPETLFERPEPTWSQYAALAQSEANYTVHFESGTETFVESGKTVFANWIQVDPGNTAEVKLVYRNAAVLKSYAVPVRDASWTDWFSGNTARVEQNVRLYSVYWQKQPGSWEPELSLSVDYPQSWQLEPVDGVKATQDGPGNWQTTQTQKKDLWWNFVMY